MQPKMRALYECMWGSYDFAFPVEKKTPNSYSFTEASRDDEDICRDRLAYLFGIVDGGLFGEKFHQSIGGDGKELKRIATVHSSSLCALLFFYGVSEKNPYVMQIEGEEYIFTYSCFEYRNEVIEGRNPSNMDVVLVGKKANTDEKVVFFVESKFSEYYEGTRRQLRIASAYLNNEYGKKIYKSGCFERMGIQIVDLPREPEFQLMCEDSCYMEGIKQMVSHYIGIRNLYKNPGMKNDVVANEVSAGAKVILGEILFTESIGRLHIGNGEECFASYQKKYRVLAEELNKQLVEEGMSEKITVLSDILSYSMFKDATYIREEPIKRFYFYGSSLS